MRKMLLSVLVASGLAFMGVSSFAVDEPRQDAEMEQPAIDQEATEPTELKGEVTSFEEDRIKLKDESGTTHSFDTTALENADEFKANPLHLGDMVIVKIEGGKAISIEKVEGDDQASAEDPAKEAGEMSDESTAKEEHPQDADSMEQGMKEEDTGLSEAPSETESGEPFAEGEQAAETAGEGEYLVKEGDTLAEIAEEHLGSQDKWGLIARANNLEDPDRIYVGQRLTIPSGSAIEVR